ncbi:helix-turn-helix transcriptional regulator [Tenacibaculum maritimum]|uniref:helix-turn-helix domain-containing protein n=1 Tax=Tenacibaculum maritimum TaxID=107401 RepID=UPI0038776DC6
MSNTEDTIIKKKEKIFKMFKKKMRKKKKTQEEIAKKLNINKSTLTRNLQNDTEMTLTSFLKICEVLEIKQKFKNIDKL